MKQIEGYHSWGDEHLARLFVKDPYVLAKAIEERFNADELSDEDSPDIFRVTELGPVKFLEKTAHLLPFPSVYHQDTMELTPSTETQDMGMWDDPVDTMLKVFGEGLSDDSRIIVLAYEGEVHLVGKGDGVKSWETLPFKDTEDHLGMMQELFSALDISVATQLLASSNKTLHYVASRFLKKGPLF